MQSRRDLSGHLTETLSRTMGKHNLTLGAEYRRIQIYAQATGRGSSSIYTRGTFSFSGGRGFAAKSGANGGTYPSIWPSSAPAQLVGKPVDSQTTALADYLQGEGSSAQLYNGNLDRSVSDNNVNLYVQDSFQVTPNFNINYGLRWDYISPVGDDQKALLSVFRPGTPANSLDPDRRSRAVVGQDIKEPYKADVLQLAPRKLGFSYFRQPPTMLHNLDQGHGGPRRCRPVL